jgi:hypothetical protein
MRPNQEKDPFTIAVGERLADCLRAAKLDTPALNQAVIRKKLNTSSSTANDWFSGVSLPKGQHLVQLATLFGCTTDWLLNGVGDTQAHTYHLLTLQRMDDDVRFMCVCQCSPVTYCLRQRQLERPVLLLNSQIINAQEYLAYQEETM